MPSARQFLNIADAAKVALDDVAPGVVKLAEDALAKNNVLKVMAEEAHTVGITKLLRGAKTTEGSWLIEDRLLVQTMSRKGPITPDMRPEEIVSGSRFKTRVVSVSANSWLGETSAVASRHLGQFKSWSGGDFGSASVLKDGYVLTANHCLEAANRLPLQSRFPSATCRLSARTQCA